jgi:hypothetical protein
MNSKAFMSFSSLISCVFNDDVPVAALRHV